MGLPQIKYCPGTLAEGFETYSRTCLNRVFQEPGPRPAIEAFAGGTVLVLAWFPEETMHEILDQALPDSRFLFCMSGVPLDEAKAVYSRLRERCPRHLG